MDEFIAVIMQKDSESGILTNEIASCRIYGNEAYLFTLYAIKEGDLYTAHIGLTTEDVEDWEFDAIYDHYDSDIFVAKAETVTEVADCVNPTWEVTARFTLDPHGPSQNGLVCDGISAFEDRLNDILNIHAAELKEIYDIIKDKKDEYI